MLGHAFCGRWRSARAERTSGGCFQRSRFSDGGHCDDSCRAIAEDGSRDAHSVSGTLKTELENNETKLLVLPYGSAFPESAWTDILGYLRRGGNLLALGGRPFTRSAYKDASGWHLRSYSVRFLRQLLIDQYQTAPGSDGLEFHANADIPLSIPAFAWKRSFSPVIRLSAVDLYARGGSAGSIDSRWIHWRTQRKGPADGCADSASGPFAERIQRRTLDFSAVELTGDFSARADIAGLVRTLVEQAAQGAESFTVRPSMPLCLPGEPVEEQVLWNGFGKGAANLSVKIAVFPQDQPAHRTEATATIPVGQADFAAGTCRKGLSRH